MLLLCLLRQVLSLVHWLTRQCFRRRAQNPVHYMMCRKFQPHCRRRYTRQFVPVADTGWMLWSRRAQFRRLVKVELILLQQPFRMKTASPVMSEVPITSSQEAYTTIDNSCGYSPYVVL